MSTVRAKPEPSFSEGFTPSLLENTTFLCCQEKQYYQGLKKEVQRDFLINRVFETKVSIQHLPSNPTTSDKGLSRGGIERFSENLRGRGFEVIKEDSYPASIVSMMLGIVLPHPDGTNLRVSCPTEDLDESGRTSPGWDPQFKASYIKHAIQRPQTGSSLDTGLEEGRLPSTEALIQSAYKKAAIEIESEVFNNPDVLIHKYDITRECPDAHQLDLANTLVRDLQAKGFTASANHHRFGVSVMISKPL